jgi:FAD dependent oxidoreductase
LLFGGGANYSGRDSRDIAGELRGSIEGTFPQLKGIGIDFQWTCTMGIVINRIPQLGKLSDNVWYCQGYSGHGIATSHVMGEIMAEALTGTLGRFDTFAAFKHRRVPFGRVLGNPLQNTRAVDAGWSGFVIEHSTAAEKPALFRALERRNAISRVATSGQSQVVPQCHLGLRKFHAHRPHHPFLLRHMSQISPSLRT